MRRNRSTTIAVVVAVVVVAATRTSAHRLDELLQAARIGIAGDRVDLELDLTPGAAVADRLITEIDRDGDGSFSAAEQRSFVDRVFAEIQMTVDGKSLRVSPQSFAFPTAAACRAGDGVIAIRASAPFGISAQGTHHLAFDNGYRRDISVYLANALVPGTNRIAVTGQERDGVQSRLIIAYDVRPQQPAALPFAIVTVMMAAVAIGSRKMHNRRREEREENEVLLKHGLRRLDHPDLYREKKRLSGNSDN